MHAPSLVSSSITSTVGPLDPTPARTGGGSTVPGAGRLRGSTAKKTLPLPGEVFEVSGQYYVPVLKDGDTVLSETRDILSHLETTYGSKAARS